MMKEEILRELAEKVEEIIGEGCKVSGEKVKKNNGVEIEGLIVTKPKENVAPTIYVDRQIEKIVNGTMTVDEVAREIIKVYQQDIEIDICVEIQELGKKEFILSHVEYQLINTRSNGKMLEGVPHKDLLDLSAIYRVVINRNGVGHTSYVLSNEIMRTAGITMEELDDAATINTKAREFQISTMAQILRAMGTPEEMVAMGAGGPRVFVLTNRNKYNGASILLYKDVLSELSERIKGDFYVIPSSIHEVLAIPVCDIADSGFLKDMVREVNANNVDDEEILGYRIYKYSWRNEILSIAE